MLPCVHNLRLKPELFPHVRDIIEQEIVPLDSLPESPLPAADLRPHYGDCPRTHVDIAREPATRKSFCFHWAGSVIDRIQPCHHALALRFSLSRLDRASAIAKLHHARRHDLDGQPHPRGKPRPIHPQTPQPDLGARNPIRAHCSFAHRPQAQLTEFKALAHSNHSE